jgi:hypothetical protein
MSVRRPTRSQPRRRVLPPRPQRVWVRPVRSRHRGRRTRDSCQLRSTSTCHYSTGLAARYGVPSRGQSRSIWRRLSSGFKSPPIIGPTRSGTSGGYFARRQAACLRIASRPPAAVRGVLSTPQINLSGPFCPKNVCVFLPGVRLSGARHRCLEHLACPARCHGAEAERFPVRLAFRPIRPS